MQTKKMLRAAVTAGTSFALAGAINIAHAAQATATVPITMQVNNPTCTVSNSASSFNLLSASSPNLTVANYLSANYPLGGVISSWYTNDTLNQTATISCDTPNTVITSFIVEPGSGASLQAGNPGNEYLLDNTSPTAQKAASGAIVMSFEQVSVNGAAAPWAYNSSNLSAYTVPFATTTSSGSLYTATVIWRPYLAVTGGTSSSTVLGNPTGGSYNATAQIVANY